MGAIKKPRKAPCRGVRRAAQAYCDCGWCSSHYYGKGAMSEAHLELAIHRDKYCPLLPTLYGSTSNPQGKL